MLALFRWKSKMKPRFQIWKGSTFYRPGHVISDPNSNSRFRRVNKFEKLYVCIHRAVVIVTPSV